MHTHADDTDQLTKFARNMYALVMYVGQMVIEGYVARHLVVCSPLASAHCAVQCVHTIGRPRQPRW